MYEVFISAEAEKYYNRQGRDIKLRLNRCIDSLGREPLSGPHIKRLHGELAGKYRYQMGSVRIIYEVDAKNKAVLISAIGSRGDVYKRR